MNSIKHKSKKDLKGGVRLYPHCRRCSGRQSQQAKNDKKKGTNKARGEKQLAQQQKSNTQPHPKPDNKTLKDESDQIKKNGIEKNGKTGQKPTNGWPKGF